MHPITHVNLLIFVEKLVCGDSKWEPEPDFLNRLLSVDGANTHRGLVP
jgi:hypothetical protein